MQIAIGNMTFWNFQVTFYKMKSCKVHIFNHQMIDFVIYFTQYNTLDHIIYVSKYAFWIKIPLTFVVTWVISSSPYINSNRPKSTTFAISILLESKMLLLLTSRWIMLWLLLECRFSKPANSNFKCLQNITM